MFKIPKISKNDLEQCKEEISSKTRNTSHKLETSMEVFNQDIYLLSCSSIATTTTGGDVG